LITAREKEVNIMGSKNDEVVKREAQTPEGVENTRRRNVYMPATDIFEDEHSIHLVADMPGVDAGSVDVTLEKNVLTISGAVHEESVDQHCLACREYPTGDYHRSFRISSEIDRDKIEARVKNGVLELVLPKAESLKPRQITVQAA
jgi:HSP20 family molecular chaperone IbpA